MQEVESYVLSTIYQHWSNVLNVLDHLALT